MNKLIDLAGSLFGVNSILAKIDGLKTYIAGAGLMLSGVAAMAGGAATVIGEIAPLHGLSAYLDFVKSVQHDPAIAVILGGFATFHMGLAAVGLRHAITKSDAPAAPPA